VLQMTTPASVAASTSMLS